MPDSGIPLITRERTEKLELLKHLITNLAHAIVVCGPEGVGKTRLLKTFQEIIPASLVLCSVQGDGQVTLEKIQELGGAKPLRRICRILRSGRWQMRLKG